MALQLVSLPVPLAISGWHLGYISFELFKEENPVMAENVSALCIREKGCFGGFLMSQNTSRIYKRVLTLHALLAPVTICLQGEIWWWQFYSEAHRSQHLTNDTCWTEQEWVPGNRNSIKKAGHCQLWAVLHIWQLFCPNHQIFCSPRGQLSTTPACNTLQSFSLFICLYWRQTSVAQAGLELIAKGKRTLNLISS